MGKDPLYMVHFLFQRYQASNSTNLAGTLIVTWSHPAVRPPPTYKKFAYQTNWLASIIMIIRRHNSGNVAFDTHTHKFQIYRRFIQHKFFVQGRRNGIGTVGICSHRSCSMGSFRSPATLQWSENSPGRHYATAKIARARTTAYAVWQFQTAAHYIKEQIHFGSHHGLRTPWSTAEAYFVCHIGPKFQISFIYAFIGCP